MLLNRHRNFRSQKYDEERSRKAFKRYRSYNRNTAHVKYKKESDTIIIVAI